jgi:hypothetical protein
MKYPERWCLALALKQPYPIPRETGAEGDTTAAPPVFQVAGGWGFAEKSVAVIVGMGVGAVLGILVLDDLNKGTQFRH